MNLVFLLAMHVRSPISQITTAPEFQKLVKDMKKKHCLGKEQKEAQAEEQRWKADANAALEHWKAQLLKRYNEGCITLAAGGVPKKLWPKKLTQPM